MAVIRPASGDRARAVPGEFSPAELGAELRHDYSTTGTGVVPPGQRRSLVHFTALWLTFAAGFTYLFLGFQYHDAGYSLPVAVGAGALGGAAYVAYALPAAYLGSRTGQTHALLSRSIFGVAGSVLVSLLLVGVAAGWAAFAFNLLATLYDGLFGWGHVVLVSVLLAIAGIVNNLFGFTGITAFARYLVAPLMIVWIGYLVIKGLLTIPAATLRGAPATMAGGPALPFLAGVNVAIGTVMWGNEPDTWRYGAPRFRWPLVPYLLAVAVGMVLFVGGGWMMGELSGAGQFDFGPAYRYVAGYSLFGALWLGAAVATVLQLAINDGNYYEMVNAGQNLVGHARHWRRWHTCVLAAAATALLTWAFPRLQNGFFTVAGWSSIALPSATVVMCVDQFVLPRLIGFSRPVAPIPSWRTAAVANWPGIAAVLAAVLYGAYGLGLLPGQHTTPSLGLVPAQAWVLAAVLYVGLAAVAVRSGHPALLGSPASAPHIASGTARDDG
jgi:purine-cytosine permease-like protein